MKEWARREVELATVNEESLAVKNAYVDAYMAFCRIFDIVDKLPPKTAELVISLVVRMTNGDPLTPIEDKPEEWELVNEGVLDYYRSIRRPSLYKKVFRVDEEKVKVEFVDFDRQICIDINEETSHKDPFVISIFNEMHPITFPYFPNGVVKIYTEQFVTSPASCESDTIGITYFRFPDGQMKKVMRFFKKENGIFSEIDQIEYCQRKFTVDKVKENTEYGKGNIPNGK